jgi:xylan 1,4-beta-xylosidase
MNKYFKITISLFLVIFFSECKQLSQCVLSKEFYINPVLGGDYPDPSVLRVGKDYYLTHSSFEYYPGLLIWHSTDLINWKRIGHALNANVGSVWAPDLIKYNNIFYIYFPAGGTNWVITAKSPEGPWSNPIDLNLHGFIDPGHVVDNDGNRYLYLSKGYIIKLSVDGLSTIGEPVFNYGGWQFPQDWSTECYCLESPKSTYRNGYHYILVAEGGTAGPATSHMVVAARSNSPYGPFENSPYNPIVHTNDRSEQWWSQGHGTLVDDIDGNWWILYHGYEKGFHTLGRQTLMLPIEWTDDNWFKVPKGKTSMDHLKKTAGEKSLKDVGLSDDFSNETLGLQWQFLKKYKPERVLIRDGELVFKADGNSFIESSPLLVNSCDTKYEVAVEFTIDDGVKAGLCMYYNEIGNARIEVDTANFTVFVQKMAKIRVPNLLGKKGFLRIVNDENEVSFYYSSDNQEWIRVERTIDVTGYNHNVFAEFLSLRAGIYVFGEGEARFDNFRYNKLR